MGKGDRKTRRGKIFRGSYGKTRPHHPRTKSDKTDRQTSRTGQKRGTGG